MKYFWNEWKDITQLERSRAKLIIKGKKKILQNIDNKEIIAILVKGSFPRRELIETSDVDIIVILKTKKYYKKVKQIFKESNNKLLTGGAYTLWELKTSKLLKISSPSKTPVARIARHFKHFPVIYGTKPPINKTRRTDKELYESMKSFFKKDILKMYANGKFSFDNILKQVLWIEEGRQRYEKGDAPFRWEDIVKQSPYQIVKKALKYRKNINKISKEKEKEFIKEIKKWLKQI